ncbi:NADH-quinone oxidoreductase subunit 5 family protein [Actinomadura sp. WAC 06369]|uniref:NADH-quinone oxidoreductase subunit 5 family protein n=1 Tax=Actinomadura sp. WAC 06369 TaxID=2203193 RepID=UPI000F77869E|nr:proton-conducting transporter membrane subunit [Actinomadura sp. WAC 06369]RSN71106.1 NADH-quinone oxidoreductase subunit L [Actinomadura sp. WAC 06369]
MIVLASLTVLLPFAAALAGFLLGPRLTRALRGGTPPRSPLRNGPALIACVPAAASLVLAAVVAGTVWRDPGPRTGGLTVVDTGTVPIRVALQVDGLSAVVALMVCCVALAVQVYSVVYLDGDRRYSSYAAFVSLFTSAMLLVVLAADLIVLYVGWEVMGVCSYFLIGHHWEEREYSRAAVKAFLTTRLGDAGFLVGIIVLGVGAGSFATADVLRHAAALPDTTATAAALLLLAGVVGKSAQFPLHTWLPDAMAGPTPVSALIHAATMVAAGVYVVARLFGVFAAAPAALAVLGVLAVVSMVGAALAALAQDDLKRVLAYSTISQLGVMAAGLAVGAPTPAVFHLLSHGAFKALLFLAAGCVIVTTGTNMLARYGGLRHGMPITFWSMTVGFAALAGVPPLSGWFSKDSVIEAAQHSALHGGELYNGARNADALRDGGLLPLDPGVTGILVTGGVPVPVQTIPTGVAWVVYLGLLLTVALTAAYAARAWLMTFFGEPRGTHDAREPSTIMSWTVAALAVPAAALGFFGLGAAELRPHLGSALLGTVLTALGAGAAFLVWNRDPALDPARALGRVRPVFARAFYVDELYAAAIVRPARALARAVVAADARGVDAAVVATGRSARRIAGPLRVPQNGNPQTYLTGLLAGVVVIAAVVVIFQ